MAIWDMVSWAAWIISGVLFAWMVFDAAGVSKQYGEDYLMSSREGEE